MGEQQRIARPEEMATTSTAISTVPPQTQEEPVERVAVITLRPTRTETCKKVVWTEDTVDNEHMNKKKSKCCCIYEKPKKFGESDSEESDEEDCDHCFGHVEKKHGKHKHQHHHAPDCPQHSHTGTLTITEQDNTPPPEQTATITLHSSEATPPLEPSAATPPLEPSTATPTPAPAPPDKQDH